MQQQVQYKDLSMPLKGAVILMYVLGSLYAVFFFAGMLTYVMGSG